eukprot:1176395-Prorocentrum_minimum.AAC.5
MRGVSQLGHRDRLTALVNGWRLTDAPEAERRVFATGKYLTGAPREARRQCSTRGLTEQDPFSRFASAARDDERHAVNAALAWSMGQVFGAGVVHAPGRGCVITIRIIKAWSAAADQVRGDDPCGEIVFLDLLQRQGKWATLLSNTLTNSALLGRAFCRTRA